MAVFPTTFQFTDGLYTNLGGSNNVYPQGRKVRQWQLVAFPFPAAPTVFLHRRVLLYLESRTRHLLERVPGAVQCA
jgi:hypothetical protein